MVWFRVDDGFHDHPKVEALLESKHASDAIALWTLAGSWCGKHLTDGEISASKVARLGIRHHAKAAQELVRVRLWEKTETGFRFHQWTERQAARADVDQTRRESADRMRRLRANQRARREETGRESIDESGNVRANSIEHVRTNDARSSRVQVSERSPTHSVPFHSVPYQNQNQDTEPTRDTLASVPREVVETLPTPSRLTCTSDLRPVPATTTQPPSIVDSSFNRRVLERVVGEVRGRPWSVPKQRFAMATRADEVVEEIREMAARLSNAQLEITPDDLCAAAFERWVEYREKRNESTQPHLWLDDWAGQLPPPPKKQEKWRDLEG